MEKITFAGARKITAPSPFTLVSTETPKGTTNLAAVSWWSYLSFQPEMLGFAMAKTSYSGEMVRKNQKVVLAMPAAGMAQQALACGTVTGRDTDKVQAFGIEMCEVPGNGIRVPAKSCLMYECTLKEAVEVGDHYLYICDIDNILGDPAQKAILVWDDDKGVLKAADA